MKFTVTLTKQDYNAYFLRSYFLKRGRYFPIPNYAGIIITLLMSGLFFWLDGHAALREFQHGFAGVCLGVGILCLLIPAIVVAQNKRKDEIFTVEFKDGFLHVQDRLATVSLNLDEYPVQSNRHYFFVPVETGQALIFPKAKIEVELSQQLAKHLKTGRG